MPDANAAAYAGFGRRLAAYLLDLTVNLGLLILIAFTIRFFRSVGIWQMSDLGVSPEQRWMALGVLPKLAVIVAFLVSSGLLYFPILEASAWQATFGKRVMNVYVATDSEGRMSTLRAFGRWTAKFSCTCFPIGLISFILIIATPKRSAIHAGTAVLQGHPVPGGTLEPWRIVVALGIPFVWTMGTMLATL